MAATDGGEDIPRQARDAQQPAEGASPQARGAEPQGLGAGALLLAALALPGVTSGTAAAQTAPDAGVVALRYFDYRDWQPGASRMRVRSPSLYALAPLTDNLSVEGSLVYDAMSGASPLYFNTLSGASGLGITDYRTAGDLKVTRWFDRFAVGVGGAVSSERDFLSRAYSVDVRTWTPDKNRTLAFGAATTRDSIDSANGIAEGRRRETYELMFGVTQVLDARSIVQSNVTWSRGRGYYDDPYKPGDARPSTRRLLAWLTRYNHHLPATDATLRFTYRLLADSWGADSHMLAVEWVQALPRGFTIAPGLRYYTQHAADFYFDPPFPRGLEPGRPYTADTRLSAFGALTPTLDLSRRFGDGWTADLRLAWYRQKTAWRLLGNGSPGLLDFSARWIELGIEKAF